MLSQDALWASMAALIFLNSSLVFIMHMWIMASASPMRSFGPALFAGGDALKDVWVFICAPLVGGALSACCWKALAPKEK